MRETGEGSCGATRILCICVLLAYDRAQVLVYGATFYYHLVMLPDLARVR